LFKIHIGNCVQCSRTDVIIPVKSGVCQYCNHENKQAKKKASGKKTGGYVYKKEATGEKHVFEIVLEKLGDVETRCFVCKEKISLITHHNFAHILRKSRCPEARLDPNNIRIMCYKIDGSGCHSKFDFNPRSELTGENWERVFALESELKKQYK